MWQMTCPIQLKSVFNVEPFLKALNASACIDQLLLAGKERMAVGANFNADILLCGACLKGVATGTGNRRPLILGMDSLFHLYLTSHNY